MSNSWFWNPTIFNFFSGFSDFDWWIFHFVSYWAWRWLKNPLSIIYQYPIIIWVIFDPITEILEGVKSTPPSWMGRFRRPKPNRVNRGMNDVVEDWNQRCCRGAPTRVDPSRCFGKPYYVPSYCIFTKYFFFENAIDWFWKPIIFFRKIEFYCILSYNFWKFPWFFGFFLFSSKWRVFITSSTKNGIFSNFLQKILESILKYWAFKFKSAIFQNFRGAFVGSKIAHGWFWKTL